MPLNDPEIRALLRPMLTGGHLVDELPVGTTRADVLHLTADFMHGYEVKGDGDTLKRLANQVACYSRSFDFVTFVVTAKHVQSALAALPEWVGLWCATPGGIVRMREAGRHDQLNKGSITSLLRLGEVKYFCQQQGLKGLSKLRAWDFYQALRENTTIPLPTIQAFVRQRLIDRLPERLASRVVMKAQRETIKARERERDAEHLRMADRMRQFLEVA